MFLWIFYFFSFLLVYNIQVVELSKLTINVSHLLPNIHEGKVRLEYTPPQGTPPSNSSFSLPLSPHLTIIDSLSGTDYHIRLFYSNPSKFSEDLIYENSITSEPDPPNNLSVANQTNETVELIWDPPQTGNFEGFQLTLIQNDGPKEPPTLHNIHVNRPTSFVLRNLTAGASYEAKLHTVLNGSVSSKFVSTNFTTIPSKPTRFIVWFRNQTTMMVLWQPPTGVFESYKLTISPPHSPQSVIFMDKEGDPPGPQQAAFFGLTPGHPYVISVQTMSKGMLSSPIEAQYRTLPLSPANISINKETLTPYSFDVSWQPSPGYSLYDKFQIGLALRHPIRHTVPREQRPLTVTFDEELKPGRTYVVEATTLSGNVPSWPIKTNITTRPLPIFNLNVTTGDLGEIWISWIPNNESTQDSFLVKYYDQDSYNTGDNNVLTTEKLTLQLSHLLPGRNYTISVSALSDGVESQATLTFQITKPSPPVIESIEPSPEGLNVAWKSDVTSRQDRYVVTYVRNDTDTLFNVTALDTSVTLIDLYPGAAYLIKVFALSYGVLSDPMSQTWTVIAPKHPENLKISKANKTSLLLSWYRPKQSLVDGFIVRYRSYESVNWTMLNLLSNVTTFEIQDLIPGERYLIRLNSISLKIESPDLQVEQTLVPNNIEKVDVVLGSDNLILDWKNPSGRIDFYLITYKSESDLSQEHSQKVPFNTSQFQNILEIPELTPGELYTFRLYTLSYSLRSELPFQKKIRTMPNINSIINLILDKVNTATLRIKYSQTKGVIFDQYKFQLDDPDIAPQTKLANDTTRSLVYHHLVPGRLYNISIWTISSDVYSSPAYRQVRLYPEPINDITAEMISASKIILKWPAPSGDKDMYEVQYKDTSGHLVYNSTSSESIQYSGLQPYNNYTFVINVMSGYNTYLVQQSVPFSKTFATLESVPGKIRHFRLVKIRPYEVSVEWYLPASEHNGVLLEIRVTYFQLNEQERDVVVFLPTETNGTLRDLIPGKNYEFEIQAVTKAGAGEKTSIQVITPILAPPTPKVNMHPIEVSHSSSTIRIRYHRNFFSNENGEIILFAIIVAENALDTSNSRILSTWSDVQSTAIWPPYQVSERFSVFSNNSEEFVIGTENCDGVSGYCNGRLKPGTTYRVRIRAYTTPHLDKFSDTSYSHPITTSNDYTTAIIISVISSLLLIISLVLIFFYRRHRPYPFIKKAKAVVQETVSIDESEMLTSRMVKLKEFIADYHLMSADSDFRFSEEFELLKRVGRDKPNQAADLPVNRTKNRFTNILPYDHSRVKLQPTDDEEGSDYINANYIPGFNSPREFIVTQGPLHSTRDDFWRMTWEQNCRAIVMLTRCIEKGREKCDHYWPFDTQPVFYGDIQVTILNESQYAHWTISEFRISRGEQFRHVRHFHFNTWPDFGVPDPPQTLVKFVRTFRERVSIDLKPILVHCSAGVGRSGTFIALDHLLQHIDKYDYIDIYRIVYDMRKERVSMVQNEQQYICIHQCLMCVMENNEDILDTPRNEIHDNQGFDGPAKKVCVSDDDEPSNASISQESTSFLPENDSLKR